MRKYVWKSHDNNMKKSRNKLETVLFISWRTDLILPCGGIQCHNIEFLIVVKLKTDSWSNSYREKNESMRLQLFGHWIQLSGSSKIPVLPQNEYIQT